MPTKIGIKVKVQEADAASSNVAAFAFEATIITEVNSVPLQNLKNEQEIEPNSTIFLKDFTETIDVNKPSEDIEEIRIN